MANDQVLFTWLSLSIFLSRDFEKMIGFFGKFSHSSSCETNVWVSQQWVCSMNQIVTVNNVLYSLTYKNNTLKSPKRQFYRWLSGFSQACVLWSRLNIRISCHGCLERKMEETLVTIVNAVALALWLSTYFMKVFHVRSVFNSKHFCSRNVKE